MSLVARACVGKGGNSAGPRSLPNSKALAHKPATTALVTLGDAGDANNAAPAALDTLSHTARATGATVTRATISTKYAR